MILINELSVFFKAHSDEVEEDKNEINYLHLNLLNILLSCSLLQTIKNDFCRRMNVNTLPTGRTVHKNPFLFDTLLFFKAKTVNYGSERWPEKLI